MHRKANKKRRITATGWLMLGGYALGVAWVMKISGKSVRNFFCYPANKLFCFIS